jgi:hypothetical protein
MEEAADQTDLPHLVHVLTTKHEKITSRKVRICFKKNSATFLAIFQTKCLLGPNFSGPKMVLDLLVAISETKKVSIFRAQLIQWPL